MTEVTDEDLLKALDRIARTHDGGLLYLYLQRVTVEVLQDPNPSDGALRAHDARRRFAHELMGRMARGMDESGGRTDSTGGQRSERPIVFRTARPVVAAGHRLSARDRIFASDPELEHERGPRKPAPGDD